MKQYKFTFQDYTSVGRYLLSEEDTLRISILDSYLDNTPSKEQKERLKNPKDWAKYAFETSEHLRYCLTAFRGEKPFATITNDLRGITICFLSKNEKGELISHLRMSYWRYIVDLFLKKDEKKYYPNKQLFLKQIDFLIDNSEQKIQYCALFNDITNELFLRSSIFDKIVQSYKREEKTTKVNISHNFVRSPEHYLDYDYLLDYKNNIKSEYFDIEKLR